MLKNKCSLNQAALDFILSYENKISSGEEVIISELVKLFRKSAYYEIKFDTYVKPPNGAIWYGLKRSGNWTRVKPGIYRKL
ncbi:hypothetical protein [Clostridium tyrobutyricum]|jgi:hypothetical protein|uniref:hypothetical protein n=1 Tax=Clostridium tyrobutyricum TaxID=1519 RepID=UPI001C381854|nr:hypothetical protein [Clostridium tyrobutyricum]MBV4429524.1 hypothetical protein [Clostridium tyrobutyricum]MBV4444745.1 hypothetical protein [Clostridium tyrobutyricum]MBV4448017.1 hypothetical protein [Clostridium tyrobutyricum]